MKALIRLLIVALAITFNEGCAPVVIDQRDALIRGYSPESTECVAAQNQTRLTGKVTDPTCPPIEKDVIAGRNEGKQNQPQNLPLSLEWQFNRHNSDSPPELCLALSGGGIRSASFSIGVLQALARNTPSGPNLDDIDVISSVSGGSYASSWLLMQYYNHYQLERTTDRRAFFARDLFGSIGDTTDTSYLAYLAANGKIFSDTSYAILAAANILASPVNFFANGLFGWHENTTPSRAAYERALKRIYSQNGNEPTAQAADPTFPDLQKFYFSRKREDRPPLFVINTTAFIEEDVRHHGGQLSNSVYDFTILQYGSDGLGRYRYPGDSLNINDSYFAEKDNYSEDQQGDSQPVTFMRAVAISGAALDSNVLVAGPSQRVLTSLANFDLGFYIDNPGTTRGKQLSHDALIFPFYYYSRYLRDTQATRIYLSDGGHSENLGAFSLIRRLCNHVIIVDAESDPAYDFESYHLLKRQIRTEVGADLVIRDIDARQPLNEAQHECDLRALDSAFSRFKRAGDLSPCARSARWLKYAANPVMHGELCCVPQFTTGPNSFIKQIISLEYIKLAFSTPCDKREAHSGGQKEEMIGAYFCAHLNDKHPFPQDQTSNEDYSPEQFRAYEGLGYCITNRWLASLGGKADEDCALRSRD